LALDTQIEQAASRPASAVVGRGVRRLALAADLITADQYLAQKAAARKRLRGVAITRLVTPGPAPDCGRAFDSPGGW
jgi:hypothetical protein